MNFRDRKGTCGDLFSAGLQHFIVSSEASQSFLTFFHKKQAKRFYNDSPAALLERDRGLRQKTF